MIACFLAQISIDETARQQMVILVDRETPRRQLVIEIGLMEAESIAWQLNEQDFARPLSHDVTLACLEACQATVKALHIVSCTDGIYQAELTFEHQNLEHRIDCRPSDGLAIVCRQKDIPIYVHPSLMSTPS